MSVRNWAAILLGMEFVASICLPADRRPRLVLSIPRREVLPADRRITAMPITLILTNLGDEPAYVSPAIGELGGRVDISIRRAGTNERPRLLYSFWVPEARYAFEDLFKLLPNRSLRRTVLVDYDPIFPGEGSIEMWAEYDATAMAEGDARAFAGVLRSDLVVVPVRKGRAEKIGEQR